MWTIYCVLHGELCVKDIRHQDGCDRRCAETLQIKDSVSQMCEQRLLMSLADEFALAAQMRLMICCDLVVAEAIYHSKCHTDFFSLSINSRAGHPVNAGKKEVFEKICPWLEETVCELLTLDDVTQKTKNFAGSGEVYSNAWLKTRLTCDIRSIQHSMK